MVMGVQPDQVAIRKVSYNFCFEKSDWKWATTAPEEHLAHDLLDPDLGFKKVNHPN